MFFVYVCYITYNFICVHTYVFMNVTLLTVSLMCTPFLPILQYVDLATVVGYYVVSRPFFSPNHPALLGATHHDLVMVRILMYLKIALKL